ncbi:MAG: UDP-GlcNAc:undecaprenyl-phosphate/decaprenyl-phosphate GlcNAc-phosphate transferase [Acidobacteriota bacterium]|jgi:UDP-GlcNAc:undecaprenyl-phosphate GlcNAc-1-phosphate transferase|nr:UDP-GlcNAc:undecaprenyl-phosphate/decaprenyl-phosphate GlcNAc-phosphate transferase [Acidobacteriota bacterium]
MSLKLSDLLPVVASFALALILTPIVRALARRWGVVARPKTDRWHKKPTAMLGGVAIFISVALVVLAHLLFVPPTSVEILNHSRSYLWVVLGASAFLFAIGLADDLFHAKPYQKLIGQVMGAAFVIYYGLSLPWTGSPAINMMLTIFWLIGITNAVNLLDNMDGLSSGIAAISSIFLAANFLINSQPTEALVLAVFAAALIGFLVYNSNPASIFMGDCGTMFIGFFLASTSLMSAAGGRSRSFLPVLAVPILVLLIPIFDTTFVTVIRKLSGRAASQGGRDHTSHRLVALGMSERRAVWMLYGFAALSGLLAMLVRTLNFDVSIAAIIGFTILLTLLGVYLAGVKVYDEEEVKAAHDKPLFAFLIDLSYKRRIFEVLLDLVLIVLAYYGAYALRFGSMTESGTWRIFLRTLPVLLFMKMAAFLVMGVYRGIWRYTSIDDLIVFAKGVIVGSIASTLAILFAFRFESVSRTVFVLDAILMLMLLAGSRMAFRLFRQILPTQTTRAGCRALIYGAGDAGELLLRELLNNRELQYSPIGFVDDDPNKKGKVIHGLRVFGGNGMLRSLCREHQIEEVLISSSNFSPARIAEIVSDCEAEQITLKRMRIRIEKISEK